MEQIMSSKEIRSQVAIPRANETEVFVNQDSSITIKQTDSYGEESIIWFSVANAPALIAAIQCAADEISDMEKDEA
jgi:hypothetical protein